MLCRSLSPLTLHLNEINGEVNKMLRDGTDAGHHRADERH